MLNIETNKIWFITDLHFGVRSNSLDWLEIQKDYYYNYFIPYIKENKGPKDILFILGDIFDNRQSINLLVMNIAIDIFEKISKIIPVYIILGNHDLYRKSTNDINSAKILSYINNIKVFQEPEVISINNNKTIFVMPWRANEEEERLCIETDKSNFLFCHTNVSGVNYNKSTVCVDGNPIELYNKYDKVFSGHIHFRQHKKNIVILGTPYQLTRGDMGNTKAICVFDPNTNKVTFVENLYSPMFIKMPLNEILDISIEEFESKIKNNFVDITYTVNKDYDFPFGKLLEGVKGYRKINIISDIEQQSNIELMLTEENLVEFDIQKFSNIYIDGLNYSDKMKDLIKTKIYNLYTKVVEKNSLGEED